VNMRARLIVGSITDARVIREAIATVDACVHLAAIASVEQCNQAWAVSHGVNQSAFVALLEFVARRPGGPIPVVYASSAAVYGDSCDLPIREVSAPRPLSAYGADKLGCELHARVAGNTAGLATFGLRFFNVYGVGQCPSSPYSGVISLFAERVLRSERVTIHGDGSQSRDFVHVSDVVRSILAALGCASSDAPVCNVGTGVETSIMDLAKTLGQFAVRPLDIVLSPARSGDIARSVADMTKTRQVLGFEARVDLAAGLKTLIQSP
jgi:UDP-glucose 4-epimerase